MLHNWLKRPIIVPGKMIVDDVGKNLIFWSFPLRLKLSFFPPSKENKTLITNRIKVLLLDIQICIESVADLEEGPGGPVPASFCWVMKQNKPQKEETPA